MALAIAGAAVGFLGPVIEVVKWFGAPIKRQFNYLCCFTSNIDSLKDEAKNLDYQTSVLQDRVTEHTNNERDIYDTVKNWLTVSGNITLRKERILREATVAAEVGCMNFAQRFSLSKEAKKTTNAIKKQLEECNFSDVSRPPGITATSPVAFGKVIYEFNSKKRFEEDIIRSLNKDKNVGKVGVWGIGGVGKTVMAQKILNRALKEGLFHEVVMVNVSQVVEKMAIQKKIAEQLGLTLREETLKPRAHKLLTRLRQGKRTLVLLDDVWEALNLEELGIPCDSEWCTIISTSRDKNVLTRMMKAGNVWEMGILLEDEAWHFFREMAGACVDNTVVHPIAYEVMKECKGLLIALESVGRAHHDMHDKYDWEYSLQQLRKSNPVDIPNVIKEVYRPLRLSYDRLSTEDERSTILLCCLFAEDSHIPLEQLTYFAMGLRLFEDIWELEEVRGRIRRLIGTLRNLSMLLDSVNGDYVRMHDVVRDVSIFIASKERRLKSDDCTWISSFVDGRGRRPTQKSSFPNLKLLFMDTRIEQGIEIDDSFVQGAGELNVLFLRNGLLRSLPHTLKQRKSTLIALVLTNCKTLESVSAVGQLESLEILILQGCGLITELPVETRRLRWLKLLEIDSCYKLERIPAGVISSMVSLEELKITESFKNWEAEVEEKERKNAGLKEVEFLKNLRCLKIQVSDSRLAAQTLNLSPKLVKFDVQFGTNTQESRLADYRSKKEYERKVYLDFSHEKNFSGDSSTNTLLTRAEYLVANGHYADINLKLAGIKWVRLDRFRNMKNMTPSAAVFPLMESLSLHDLDSLEEIWDAPIPSDSFNNLKQLSLVQLPALKELGKNPYRNSVLPLYTSLSSVQINYCNKLVNLFSSSTAKDGLLQLESIDIWYCQEMEQLVLVWKEENDRGDDLLFPKLKRLQLDGLPNLTSLFKGVQSLRFPEMDEVKIRSCPNLKCLVSSTNGEEDPHYRDADSLHLFCQPKVSFGNLKNLLLWHIDSKSAWCDQVPIGFFNGLQELEICRYSNIKSLFSSTIAQNLVNLQKLYIDGCVEMVKVIEDEDTCGHTTKHHSLLPSLQNVKLSHLPILESFCEWRCALELPSLTKLDIVYCHEMRSFSAGSLLTNPALQTSMTNFHGYKFLESVQDLNGAVQQYYEELQVIRVNNNV